MWAVLVISLRLALSAGVWQWRCCQPLSACCSILIGLSHCVAALSAPFHPLLSPFFPSTGCSAAPSPPFHSHPPHPLPTCPPSALHAAFISSVCFSGAAGNISACSLSNNCCCPEDFSAQFTAMETDTVAMQHLMMSHCTTLSEKTEVQTGEESTTQRKFLSHLFRETLCENRSSPLTGFSCSIVIYMPFINIYSQGKL